MRNIVLKCLVFVGLGVSTTSAFAEDWKEITGLVSSTVEKCMRETVYGKQYDKGETDYDDTLVYYTRALGWAKINNRIGESGQVHRTDASNPITGETGWKYFSKYTMTFSFDSWTRAIRREKVTGNIVDYPWLNSYPHGTVTVLLNANHNTNLDMEFIYTVVAGDDRPNNFVERHVAILPKGDIANCVRRIVPNITVR